MPTAEAVARCGNETKSSPRVVMRPMLRKRYETESRNDEIAPMCIQTAKIPALMRLPGVEHVRQRQVTFATIASH